MRVGRYELVRQLGAGGHGSVWAAVVADGSAPRAVALKLVPKAAEVVREARLGALLRHAHLVDVYEVGEHEGTWFFAMERCDGGTLAERLPLPPRAVVEAGLAICSALAYASAELGLVHLDLKPQNLLLHGATVKVADLGLASAEGRRTRRGGTPGYIAPEVLTGGVVDRRADVWAMGVVLHELATGERRAASSGGSDTLSLDDDDDLGGGDLPTGDGPAAAWLAPVVDRCLAHHPWDRFQTMDELAAALRALDAPGPGLAEALGAAPSAPSPAPTESLVGRESLLAEVRDALAAPGLVTLRGPAGIGKSALARATAGADAWFVPVGGAASDLDLVAAIGSVVRVDLDRGGAAALASTLGHALRARGPGLLVLDGFEHLVAHRGIVATLRDRAPDLRLLVTSREALGLPGERVVDVAPLSAEGSARLFVAAAARRGVALAVDDPRVATLAGRLEGLPLALELAAGRLGVLDLDEVIERLALSFLRGAQTTLEGALASSWELLDAHEREVLAQLSVFRGDWTPELLAQVVAVDGLPPERIGAVAERLVERSLVRRSGPGQRMLGVVREFALGRLRDRVEAEARHGWAFAAFADELADADPRRAEGLSRALSRWLDDLVAAFERACARGDGEVAAATALGAAAVVARRGPQALGLAWLERALAVAPAGRIPALRRALVRSGLDVGHWERCEPHVLRELEESADADPERRGTALYLLGLLRRGQGRGAEAVPHLEAARAAARARGDRSAELLATTVLGAIEAEAGRVEASLAPQQAALRIAREIGSRRMEAACLTNLGNAWLQLGRFAEARRALDAALDVQREREDRRAEGLLLASLARLAQLEGRVDEARTRFGAALAALRAVGHRAFEGATLGLLATLHHRAGHLPEARAAYEEALAIDRETGNRRHEGMVVSALGELCWLEGRADDARGHLLAAHALAREVGNRRAEGVAATELGRLAAHEGRADEAIGWFEAAIALHRATRGVPLEVRALAGLGHLRARRGERGLAREVLEAALGLARTVEDRECLGTALTALADLDRREGRLDRARAHLGEAVEALGAVGDHEQLAGARCVLAHLELDEDRPEAAAAALGEARELARRVGAHPGSWIGTALAEVAARLR